MSWSDPIVDEVRRARDAYAARFNDDLRAIFRDLKEKEKRSGRKQRGHNPLQTIVSALRTYLITGQLPPLPDRVPANG